MGGVGVCRAVGCRRHRWAVATAAVPSEGGTRPAATNPIPFVALIEYSVAATILMDRGFGGYDAL